MNKIFINQVVWNKIRLDKIQKIKINRKYNRGKIIIQ